MASFRSAERSSMEAYDRSKDEEEDRKSSRSSSTSSSRSSGAAKGSARAAQEEGLSSRSSGTSNGTREGSSSRTSASKTSTSRGTRGSGPAKGSFRSAQETGLQTSRTSTRSSSTREAEKTRSGPARGSVRAAQEEGLSTSRTPSRSSGGLLSGGRDKGRAATGSFRAAQEEGVKRSTGLLSGSAGRDTTSRSKPSRGLFGGGGSDRAGGAVGEDRLSSAIEVPDSVIDTILAEAGGEGRRGIDAVNGVIANRSRIGGQSLEEVVSQRHQFEGYNRGTPAGKDGLRDYAKRSLQQIIAGEKPNPVGDADHYHADYVSPTWASKIDKTQVVGRHTFYDDKRNQWPGANTKNAPVPQIEIAQPGSTAPRVQLASAPQPPARPGQAATLAYAGPERTSAEIVAPAKRVIETYIRPQQTAALGLGVPAPQGRPEDLTAPPANQGFRFDAPPVAQDQLAISSGYGMRRHPIHGDRRFHRGIDIVDPAGEGAAIQAVAGGTITR
ncbi:MAG: cell wall hydrolase, partial [Pseudomonadota bacterium]